MGHCILEPGGVRCSSTLGLGPLETDSCPLSTGVEVPVDPSRHDTGRQDPSVEG